jgi:curved DNA-binding protein CbpA
VFGNAKPLFYVDRKQLLVSTFYWGILINIASDLGLLYRSRSNHILNIPELRSLMSFQIKHGIFKLNIIDHYAVLGIELNSSPKEIRAKYLKIAQKLHPDTSKTKSDTEKKLASEVLSKLVNPAYEELSKDKTRNEYLLVLSQLGQRLAEDKDRVKFSFETAQKLLKAGDSYELEYKNILKKISPEQYESLNELIDFIGQISELNLGYLIHQQGKKLGNNERKLTLNDFINTPNTESQPTVSNQSQKTQSDEISTASKVPSYIRRAQEYIGKNLFTQAITELRDAIKLDPNNSSCHALIGLAYLKQNQMSMARVHIDKAWKADPKDPIALNSKQELDKLDKASDLSKKTNSTDRANTNNASNKSTNSSMFGGLFGGKKK